MTTSSIRFGIVGCGAIAQAHARALRGLPNAQCTALFDVDPARAEMLRRALAPGSAIASSLSTLAKLVDVAIVATPNSEHASAAVELLEAGVHVLCEKPLALTVQDAERMVEAAGRASRLLGCGLVRRFFGSTQLLADALARELVGRPEHVEVSESVFNWPLGRAAFDRRISGGGAFMDLAPHVLDLLHVLFGELEVVSYEDDATGGVESTGRATIRCRRESRVVDATLRITRAAQTPNFFRVQCERGRLETNPHEPHQLRAVFTGGRTPFEMRAIAPAANPFQVQLERFCAAVRGEAKLPVSGQDALPSVRALVACYASGRPLAPAAPAAPVVLRNAARFKKVLVTGAAGAVGSRLVERFAAADRLGQLRCVVRSLRSASRILRHRIELVDADLTDAKAVRRAIEGCDAVVHLAVGDRAAAETRPLVEAAQGLGIRRFVHMSSAAVYGRKMPVEIEQQQERTPLVDTGEPYADQKAAAERIVLKADLEAIVLRPHMVYGPWLRWSYELPHLLRLHAVPKLDPSGWCNLIYVDDLVDAVVRGLEADTGFGQPLFVTDGAPLRWSAYIDRHAELVDDQPAVVDAAQFGGSRTMKQWLSDSIRPIGPVLRSREVRNLVLTSPLMQATALRAYVAARDSRLLGPVAARLRGDGNGNGVANDSTTYDPTWVSLQISEARLSSRAAEEAIGFRAHTSFDEGFRVTADWMRAFGLIER